MVSGDRPSNNREGVRTGRATTGQGVERSQSLCRMSGPGRVKQTEEHESSLDLSRRVEVLAQLADEQEKLRANLSLGLSAVQAVSFLVAREDEKALRLSAAVSVERKAAHALGVIQDLRVKMRERCGYLDRVVSANTSRLLHVQTLTKSPHARASLAEKVMKIIGDLRTDHADELPDVSSMQVLLQTWLENAENQPECAVRDGSGKFEDLDEIMQLANSKLTDVQVDYSGTKDLEFLLAESRALVAKKDQQETPGPCARCKAVPGDEEAFLRCLQCDSVDYCSIECQHKHWSAGHRAECGRLAKMAAAEQSNLAEEIKTLDALFDNVMEKLLAVRRRLEDNLDRAIEKREDCFQKLSRRLHENEQMQIQLTDIRRKSITFGDDMLTLIALHDEQKKKEKLVWHSNATLAKLQKVAQQSKARRCSANIDLEVLAVVASGLEALNFSGKSRAIQ